MKTVIEMAREAGLRDCICDGTKGCLERFAELVRADAIADERENGQKWFDAVTAQHKQAILAEREACAKVCDIKAEVMAITGKSCDPDDLAAAIRERSKT